MKATESPTGGLLLSRCVLDDQESMPVAVAAWLMEHARLPEEHKLRVRELYDKQMNENISENEIAELDRYAEIIATVDVLRARAKSIVRQAA